MKKLLAIILALACCLSLMACSTGETTPGTTESSQTQPPTKPSADSATQAPNTLTQATQPVMTQPQQNMCYWCGELPVGDFETYCVNCRCLKCDKLRKDGAVENMCIVRITTAMRACVNIPHLRTVSTAPSTSAANPTAIIAVGLDLNTAHIISKPTRQGSYLCLVLV